MGQNVQQRIEFCHTGSQRICLHHFHRKNASTANQLMLSSYLYTNITKISFFKIMNVFISCFMPDQCNASKSTSFACVSSTITKVYKQMFVVAFDKKYVSSFDNLDSQISQNIQYLPVLAILFRSAVSYSRFSLDQLFLIKLKHFVCVLMIVYVLNK